MSDYDAHDLQLIRAAFDAFMRVNPGAVNVLNQTWQECVGNRPCIIWAIAALNHYAEYNLALHREDALFLSQLSLELQFDAMEAEQEDY